MFVVSPQVKTNERTELQRDNEDYSVITICTISNLLTENEKTRNSRRYKFVLHCRKIIPMVVTKKENRADCILLKPYIKRFYIVSDTKSSRQTKISQVLSRCLKCIRSLTFRLRGPHLSNRGIAGLLDHILHAPLCGPIARKTV